MGSPFSSAFFSLGISLKRRARVEGHGGNLLINQSGIMLIIVNFDLLLGNPCHNLERVSIPKNRLILKILPEIYISLSFEPNVKDKFIAEKP